MIKEFELYHGSVFSRLLHHGKQKVIIELFPSKSNCSYLVNKNIGIFIKYCTSRMSPWSFTFKKEHQDEIQFMYNEIKNLFVVFVCNEDGIACLRFEELKNILDCNHEESEWVRISRRPREMYSISGKDGKLKFKIGENEFPSKLFDNIK